MNFSTKASRKQAGKDACATSDVAQASSLHHSQQTMNFSTKASRKQAGKDACATSDDISSLQREHLRSGMHERGYLPHLKSDGGTYFITFRLSDSLPLSVLKRFEEERQLLEQKAMRKEGRLSADELRRLAELFSDRIESYLDSGSGECWLKRADIAQTMKQALLYFESQRYELHEWVVMPNHVHVVVTPKGEHTLSSILHSWKSFTANRANKILGRWGNEFWQRESYDHLIRDEEEYWRIRKYVRDNPVKAGLCAKPEDWPWGSAASIRGAGPQSS